jgi:protein gp37
MAENSAIAWCDHTHNEWIGCAKVSAGCDNCFAEAMMDKRYHRVQWGQRKMPGVVPSVGTRSLTSEVNRRKPYGWQRKAAEFYRVHGRRQRVFCSSLSDVFDNQVSPAWRWELWSTVTETPDLDWLLLTKRPENIQKMLGPWERIGIPKNVWLGTTCEDQAAYDRRWPILREVPAAVRFISYEPAVGPLRILGEDQHSKMPDWLICGGESGPGFREMPLQWANDIGWICRANGVAFFMKQVSGFKPKDSDIPPGLLVREFPVAA